MSEELQEQEALPTSNSQGPGEILKQAREKLGLSVADIAAKLHLKIINIEAIEADNYDPKISATFTKGYLKLYARQVHIEEQVVLDAFALQNVEEKEPQKLQSFSKRVAKQTNDDRLMLLTYLIIAALLALVVIWWFQQDSSDNLVASVPQQTATEQNTSTPVNTEQVAEQSEPTADDLIVSAQLANANGSDVLSEVSDTTDEVAQDAAPQETIESDSGINQELVPPTAELGPQTIELVFEFADDCWMNLTDATGEDIAYGVKKAGRVMTVSGVMPFEVTLGAPDVVKISYDGVMVDMSRFPAGKSAKFSLPFSQ